MPQVASGIMASQLVGVPIVRVPEGRGVTSQPGVPALQLRCATHAPPQRVWPAEHGRSGASGASGESAASVASRTSDASGTSRTSSASGRRARRARRGRRGQRARRGRPGRRRGRTRDHPRGRQGQGRGRAAGRPASAGRARARRARLPLRAGRPPRRRRWGRRGTAVARGRCTPGAPRRGARRARGQWGCFTAGAGAHAGGVEAASQRAEVRGVNSRLLRARRRATRASRAAVGSAPRMSRRARGCAAPPAPPATAPPPAPYGRGRSPTSPPRRGGGARR